MNELKRIFHKKYVLFVLALLIVNAYVLVYGSQNDVECAKIYDRLILMSQEYKESGRTCREAMVTAWKTYAEQNGIDVKTITDAQKKARAMALDNAQYIDDYAGIIQERINSASKILNAGIYAKNSFESINLAKNRHDLRTILNANPGFSNGIWLERLYNYHYIQIFIIILLCITIYSFFMDRKNGLYALIHAGAQGRLRLFLKRAAILALESAAASVIFYAESAAILLARYGGAEGIMAQALEDEAFLLTSASLTRIAFLGVMMFLCALSAFALSMMLWFVLSFFSNINLGIFVFLLLCGLEVLIHFVISPKMVLRVFHYFNIYYLLYPAKALEYGNWGYSFGIVRLLDTTVFLALFFILAMTAANLYLNVRHYYSGRQNLPERIMNRMWEMGMRAVSKLPAGGKELYKILISQRGIVILAGLCILAIKMDAGHPRMYSSFESAMLEYYEKAHGMEYGVELEEIYEDFREKYENDLAGLDMTDETDLQRAGGIRQILDAMRANVDYLRARQESGVAAIAINPYEYDAIYGKPQEDGQKFLALVNILAVVVISAGFLSYERKSGTVSIALACFGRKKWLVRKLLVSFGLIAMFEGLTYGIYYRELAGIYHFENLSAPLKSLPMFENYPVNPPIWGFIAIDLLMRFLFLSALSVCISAISRRVNYIYCVLLGLAAALPQLLNMIGFSRLDFLSPGNYAAFLPLYHMGPPGLNAYLSVFIVLAAGSAFLFHHIAYKNVH